jgi:heptaprenyl diphosphate synthase
MSKPEPLSINAEDRQIAWLAALAIAIHLLESGFPSPVPGLKPGLANIVTLLVLQYYGWQHAAWVSLLRVIAGSLILGTFMSPTFILSAAGAIGSLFALAILWYLLPKRWFGLVGFSILAAVAHILSQLFAAWTLYIPHPGILKLIPVLLLAGIFFGLFNAIIAHSLDGRIKRLRNTANCAP